MPAAITRPFVSVYDAATGAKCKSSQCLPAVFTAPVRPDLVLSVHTRMAKNKRQPYAVSRRAGHQTSAESWGTGRAVARIPRVSGGGTPRSGQAAFGNMCRKGRMFAPTKVWRRWHVRINKRIRRAAVASSLAATAVPSLVLARGHRVEKVPELPLVISNFTGATTRQATETLKKLGAFADIEKVIDSKSLRAGRGKMRNRRHRMRRGPLIVYTGDNNIEKAFRNIPGVELCSVQRLNLLQLAPGGHLGRFVIWTEEAFATLDGIFGSHAETTEDGTTSAVFPRHMFSNPDLARILGSETIQAALRPAGPKRTKRPFTQKKNPLRNRGVMLRLNPYARVAKRAARDRQANAIAQKRSGSKTKKARGSASAGFVSQLLSA